MVEMLITADIDFFINQSNELLFLLDKKVFQTLYEDKFLKNCQTSSNPLLNLLMQKVFSECICLENRISSFSGELFFIVYHNYDLLFNNFLILNFLKENYKNIDVNRFKKLDAKKITKADLVFLARLLCLFFLVESRKKVLCRCIEVSLCDMSDNSKLKKLNNQIPFDFIFYALKNIDMDNMALSVLQNKVIESLNKGNDNK